MRVWISAHVELKAPEWDQSDLASMTDAEILAEFREEATEIIKGEWEVHREPATAPLTPEPDDSPMPF